MEKKLLFFFCFICSSLFAIESESGYPFEKMDAVYDSLASLETPSLTTQLRYDQFVEEVKPFALFNVGRRFSRCWEDFLLSLNRDVVIWTITTSSPLIQFDSPENVASAFLIGSFFSYFVGVEYQQKWMEKFIHLDASSETGTLLNEVFEKCRDLDFLKSCEAEPLIRLGYLERKDIYDVYHQLKDKIKLEEEKYLFQQHLQKSFVLMPLPSVEERLKSFQENLHTLLMQSSKRYSFQPRRIEIDASSKKINSTCCVAIDENGPIYKTFYSASSFDMYNQLFWAIVNDDVSTFAITFQALSNQGRDYKETIVFEHLGWDVMTAIVKYKSMEIFNFLKHENYFFVYNSYSPCEETLKQIASCESISMQKMFLEYYLCHNRSAQCKMVFSFDDIQHLITTLPLSKQHQQATLKNFTSIKDLFFPAGYIPCQYNRLYQITNDNKFVKKRMQLLTRGKKDSNIKDILIEGVTWTFEVFDNRHPKLELLYASLNADGIIELPKSVDGIFLERFSMAPLSEHSRLKGLIFPSTLKMLLPHSLPQNLKSFYFMGPPPSIGLFGFDDEDKKRNFEIFYLQTYAKEWETEIQDGKWHGFPAKSVDNFNHLNEE